MEAKTQEWNVSSYENVGLMPRLLFSSSYNFLAFAMLTPPLPPPLLPPLPLHIPPQLLGGHHLLPLDLGLLHLLLLHLLLGGLLLSLSLFPLVFFLFLFLSLKSVLLGADLLPRCLLVLQTLQLRLFF